MPQPYLGEVRIFAGKTAPAGWSLCEGQLLPTAQYDTLFNLIGTTYGGDGQTHFALPDLRGRIPVHAAAAIPIGTADGAETVTLAIGELPAHTHPLMGSPNPAVARGPVTGVFARTPADAYASEFTPQPLHPFAVSPIGGGRPHPNVQPFLCVNFIIALDGLYPSKP